MDIKMVIGDGLNRVNEAIIAIFTIVSIFFDENYKSSDYKTDSFDNFNLTT
jgi:hypothetical protein